jgi:hypothetical protein
MKKLILIGLLAGTFAACNNASESTEVKQDSLDSAATEQKEVIDSTADQKMERIDSTTDKKKDSLDRIDSTLREHAKDTSK